MKKALLLGTGSKWGKSFSEQLLAEGFHLDIISGTKVVAQNAESFNLIQVDWQNFRAPDDIYPLLDQLKFGPYDLIFFNHNAPGAPDEWEFQNEIQIAQWSHSFWLNCQLPALLIDKLSQKNLIQNDTRIGWMLTGLINGQSPDFWRHAGYASCKYTNMAMLQGFSKYRKGIYFGVQPGSFSPENYRDDSLKILKLISQLTQAESGLCFNKDGSSWNIHF